MTEPSTQGQVNFLPLPLQAPSDPVTSAHPPPSCLSRVTKEASGVSVYRPTGKEAKAAQAPTSPGLETSPRSTPYRRGGTGHFRPAFSAPGPTWPFRPGPPLVQVPTGVSFVLG